MPGRWRHLKRCPDCGALYPGELQRHRSRTCPGYGELWAGDQRRKLFENLGHYGDQVQGFRPRVLLGAVTGPGADRLPWDVDHCRALGQHRHSGLLGCRVDPEAADPYNDQAPASWRALHSHVMTRCRRDGRRPWLLARVWEMQHRGVLHVHPVMAYSTAAERAGATAYLHHLADLAPAYGFGFVERKREVREARQAAAYLSAYFVTGRKQKAQLHESVRARGMPRSIVYVSTKLTMATRCTMRALRLRRFFWVRFRVAIPYGSLEAVWGAIAASRAPPLPSPV